MGSPTLIGVPATGRSSRHLRIVTRCGTLDEFIATFRKFTDEKTLFIVTNAPRPVGARQPFEIQLKDHEVIMRGDAAVIEAHTNRTGPGMRNGMRIELLAMDAPSTAMHSRLLAARQHALPPPIPPVSKEQPAVSSWPDDDQDTSVSNQQPTGSPLPVTPMAAVVGAPAPRPPTLEPTRTPGAVDTLPANPFGELPEEALEYFVECTLYEDTGLHPVPRDPEPAAMTSPPPSATPAPVLNRPPTGPPMAQVERRAPTVPPGAFGATPPPELIRPGSPWFDSLSAPVPATESESESESEEDAPDEPAAVAEPVAVPVVAAMPMAMASSPRVAERAPDDDADDDLPVRRRGRSMLMGAVVTGLAAAAGGVLAGYLVWGGRSAPSAPVVAAGASATTADTANKATPAPTVVAKDPPTESPPADRAVVAPEDPKDNAVTGGACTATFTTVPADVAVLIDGVEVGKTPLAGASIPCGELTVVLERPRYESIERKLVARAGEPLMVDERLVRPEGTLEVVTTPAGAAVTVGGAGAGAAPAQAKVQAFTSVMVTAKLDGYKPWSKKVYVRGRSMRVSAKLESLGKKPKPAKGRPAKKSGTAPATVPSIEP